MPHTDENHEQSRHVVVIVGGAVAGSEAALACAKRGAWAIVLEQGERPFGKIEDGLPRWHEKLRQKEYEVIQKNLSHPNIDVVPLTTLGRDLSVEEVVKGWAVSALLLSSGAWRDRPLFEGAEAYYGRGLLPQNAFVHWYNHYPETAYDGPHYEVPDGAIVVGGGLASIDVAKIINLELYKRALRARGHHVTTLELEHEGIAQTLTRLGVTREALGVMGTTLLYRREKSAMPIASAPENATPDQLAKVAQVREKLIDKVIERYLVRFTPNRALAEPIIEDGAVRGLRVHHTRTENGKLVTLRDSVDELRSALVVSSIGSIPMPITGIPMRGELIDFADFDSGRVRGFEGVFGLGNALTGKGNIKDSRRNAATIATQVAEVYLGLRADDPSAPIVEQQMDTVHARAHDDAERIAEEIERLPRVQPNALAKLRSTVRALQTRVGYTNDLATWLARGPQPATET